MTQIIKNAGDKVTIPVEEINIDQELMTSVEYGIRSIPTMVILDENGTEVKRHVGAMNESQLLEFLKV